MNAKNFDRLASLYGYAIYALAVTGLLSWFIWVMVTRKTAKFAQLNLFYASLLTEKTPVDWSDIAAWQYLVLLPLHIGGICISALCIIPFTHHSYWCTTIVSFLVMAHVTWISSFQIFFVGMIFGTYTNDFEVYMALVVALLYFVACLLMFFLLKLKDKIDPIRSPPGYLSYMTNNFEKDRRDTPDSLSLEI